eukprot:Lithocolla_globosa_v1_NODE_2892_length_1832_cov_154.143500.p3 type:complete len:145 gc:universal NODE_2892_length_1832_cov_154.143500:1214-1648(+)
MPKQVALEILRFSAIPKLDYVIRTVEPTQPVLDELRRFDSKIWDAYRKLRDLPATPYPGPEDNELCKPVWSGGRGLRSCEKIAPLAYLAGVAQAVPHLQAATQSPVRCSVDRVLTKLNNTVAGLLDNYWGLSRKGVVQCTCRRS